MFPYRISSCIAGASALPDDELLELDDGVLELEEDDDDPDPHTESVTLLSTQSIRYVCFIHYFLSFVFSLPSNLPPQHFSVQQ